MNAIDTAAAAPPAPAATPGILAMVREDCRCVFARDPAARSRLEVLTIYPGVQAIALHRFAHAWWRAGWKYPARVLAFVARGWTSIEIHPAARIGRRLFIDHGCGVVIGETAVIGDDVTMYHGVTLGGTSWNPGKRHPSVGNGVIIGAGAKILGNITVGDQARVAANSVVIADVPPGMTVVGIPGRIVKPQDMRVRRAGAIDLDHHEIPDPVGRALACLLDRIEFLETRLTEQRHGTAASRTSQPRIDPPHIEAHPACAECAQACTPVEESRHDHA